MQLDSFKYFAFISYNSKDIEWGKRVQKKLEGYKMPATLCSKHGWKRKPIKPVFFAPTDIQPGGLSEELKERLRASRNLIVICSPNSAKSEWVGKEIEFFHKLGRTKQIHFFIVDGEPHSGNPDTECFNPVVDTLGLPEILGANIHERTQTIPFSCISWPWMDKQRAYVQLISKLLGVEFDTIWQRHKRLLVQKTIAWTIGVMAILIALLGVWIMNQPVDVEVRLNEVSAHNEQLPPLNDAIVTILFDNKTEVDTIPSLEEGCVFTNIPHRYLGKKIHVKVSCQDFIDVNSIVVLTKDVILNIQRNPSQYGDVHFRLWNPDREEWVANVEMEIAGQKVISDNDGHVSLFVPLKEQQKKYHIKSSVPLEKDTIYLPCGPDDVILVK